MNRKAQGLGLGSQARLSSVVMKRFFGRAADLLFEDSPDEVKPTLDGGGVR